jgi:putative FmdB family regulatory protein
MPTYEYACSKCGEHLEVVQSFNDDPLKKCPACGGRLKKVFGAVGIVFKGSGFYKTDSRNASKASKVTAGAEKGGSEKAGAEKAGSGDKAGSSDSGPSTDSTSTSKTPGPDKAKTGATKDSGSSSKSAGSTSAPAAAS